MIIKLSAAALLLGFLMDMLLGDPRGLPHIIIAMGKLISGLERLLRRLFPKTAICERLAGAALVFIVLSLCTAVPAALMFFTYRASPWLGMAAETLLCWQLLAAKSLRDESMKVYVSLKAGDLTQAQRDVSMIVGRDTNRLDEAGVTRAAVETVAENASDGVAAPLFYLMLGGAPLGCLYKAVNTMDSMVGYKNSAYLDFGRAAARLDDALGYIPSRLTARLMILAAALTGMDGRNAKRIYRRDKRKHASPNSAHTEAVCAGALHIRLAGDAYYFGRLHKKEFIGDDDRPVEREDIPRANRLMLCTSVLMLLFSLAVRAILIGGICIASL